MMRVPDVAPVQDSDQALKRLADLPRAAWTQVERPSAGYNNRTLVYCLGQPHEALLDTGAATSAISEETVVGILNRARREGYTAADPEWPVQALEDWGSVEEASGVSRNAPLQIVGQVVLRLELRTVDDQRVMQPMRLKIFKWGCSAWDGLIIGAPALEAPPAGMGYRATLGGHVLDALGVTLPRLELPAVEQRIERTLAAIYDAVSSPEAAARGGAARPGRQGPSPAAGPGFCLLELAPACGAEDEVDGVAAAAVAGAVPALAGAARPVLLDADEVTLSDGDGAWVPAVLVQPAPGPGPWQLRPNALSRVEAVVGEWDGERGMLLVMNVLQPEVTLRRGDLVAAALAAEA